MTNLLNRGFLDILNPISNIRDNHGMSNKIILLLFSEKLHLIISMLQMTNLLERGFWDTLNLIFKLEMTSFLTMEIIPSLIKR
jgi:hypothetical protein